MSARAPSGIGQGRRQTLDVGAGDLHLWPARRTPARHG
jgi:hypothetical protein